MSVDPDCQRQRFVACRSARPERKKAESEAEGAGLTSGARREHANIRAPVDGGGIWLARNGRKEDSGQQDAEPTLAGELEAIPEADRP